MGYFEQKKLIPTYQNFHIMPVFIKLRVFCWIVCHLTPMLLMVSKQDWCHFEALECILHLNLKKFPSVNQLTHNQQNTAFPNIWSTLYITHELINTSILVQNKKVLKLEIYAISSFTKQKFLNDFKHDIH